MPFIKSVNILLGAMILPWLLNAGERVGLLVMATGQYDAYAVKMVESARKHFLPGKDRTFFIFTNSFAPEGADIVRIEQKKLGWPDDSLKRFHVYMAHKEMYHAMDYLYCIDADMEFVSDVGDEILGDLVATRHWGFLHGPGTFCSNKKSTAFVPKDQRKKYCTKSFYGGKREEMLNLFSENIRNIDQDLEKKVKPKWLDEAYLNKYFVDHPPTILLGLAYNYPEGGHIPAVPKLLVHLNKPSEMRKSK